MKSTITEHCKMYIRKHYKVMSRKDMARALGLKSITGISGFMKKEGLKVSKAQSRQFAIKKMTGKTTFTPEEDAFIEEHYLKMPIKTLGKKMGRSYTGIMARIKALGLEIQKEVIERNKNTSYFKKGHVPANKGKKLADFMSPETIKKFKANQYKKGHVPHNTNTEGNGAISVRKDSKTKTPYKYIRLELGKWDLLHRYIWEKAYGSIPEGYVVRFKDGNSLNCILENLECVTLAENLNKNWHDRYSGELKESIKKINKLKRTLNNIEK